MGFIFRRNRKGRRKIEKRNIERKEIEKIYGKISPFELRAKLINLAEGQKEKSARILLEAGRGNPNWIAATPREAFFTFGQFAVSESRRIWNEGDLAGMPEKKGIAARFQAFLDKERNSPGAELLGKIFEYGVSVQGFDPDEWIHELADAIIGDNYPTPNRMLRLIEKAVHHYLVQELCYNKPPAGRFNLFAVEGATAAMCYIFDSLIANDLLAEGDRVALMTPIFTPYLEIPLLPRYNFKVVEIRATETTDDGTHTWQYPDSELDKLEDSSIKALFVINPSNPPSVSMRPESMKRLTEIVKERNPDLMIISDDVYATFSGLFRSLIAVLPYNTIAVYSFSKYFGVTGWRLGTIALHEKNVFDRLISVLPERNKEEQKKRYAGISTNPEEIPFIDRIVADSRQVALNHTAGLSTPQQVQMAFFVIFAMLDRENRYRQLTRNICHRRQKLLFQGLDLGLRKDDNDAAYYTEFDLLEWAGHYYGNEFATYLQNHFKPIDILLRMAEEFSIVLLNGGGFHGPEWSIRISMANLNDENYLEMGKYLHKILEDYVKSWNDSKEHEQI